MQLLVVEKRGFFQKDWFTAATVSLLIKKHMGITWFHLEAESIGRR
jgi:hypothetical protein